MKVWLCISFFVLPLISAIELPTFNVDKESITVSGVSAGAAFATQFHVAYSSEILGSGTWAGIPYGCASLQLMNCMYGFIDVLDLIRKTENVESAGRIDLTSNLDNDRVYIFHGTRDTVVFPEVSEKSFEFWRHFVKEGSNILLKNEINASHSISQDGYGYPCGGVPSNNDNTYVQDCDYNSVFAMLNHILGGNLNEPNPIGTMEGTFEEFDQTEFYSGTLPEHSMDDTGFVYIPPACADGTVECKLHIFFHGCKMYADLIGLTFIRTIGLVEVADTNNIIIIFPQTSPHYLHEHSNPFGCYDWYGFTNPPLDLTMTHATKEGHQMDTVHNMMLKAAGM